MTAKLFFVDGREVRPLDQLGNNFRFLGVWEPPTPGEPGRLLVEFNGMKEVLQVGAFRDLVEFRKVDP